MSIRETTRRFVPRPMRRRIWTLIHFVRTQWTILKANVVSVREAHTETLALPPPRLRHRVSGGAVLQEFLASGERSAEDLRVALRRIGREFYSFEDVLDFGCGCGRVSRWFHDHPPECSFYGSDIDSQAIRWCRESLDFATFATNEPLPPLPFPDGKFDLVYSISIFTHIDEEYQFAWLEELKRVIRPGGFALLTFHSETNWSDLDPAEQAKLREQGFLYKVGFTGALKPDGLPDFYQAAYHTEPYVLETCGRYFKVHDFIDKGLENYQSIAILEREGA